MKINFGLPTICLLSEVSEEYMCFCLHHIHCLLQYFFEARLESETFKTTGSLPVFVQQAAAAKTIQYLSTLLCS